MSARFPAGNRPAVGRFVRLVLVVVLVVIVRPACGPGSLPARINTTGATPPKAGGGCDTARDARCHTPPID